MKALSIAWLAILPVVATSSLHAAIPFAAELPISVTHEQNGKTAKIVAKYKGPKSAYDKNKTSSSHDDVVCITSITVSESGTGANTVTTITVQVAKKKEGQAQITINYGDADSASVDFDLMPGLFSASFSGGPEHGALYSAPIAPSGSSTVTLRMIETETGIPSTTAQGLATLALDGPFHFAGGGAQLEVSFSGGLAQAVVVADGSYGDVGTLTAFDTDASGSVGGSVVLHEMPLPLLVAESAAAAGISHYGSNALTLAVQGCPRVGGVLSMSTNAPGAGVGLIGLSAYPAAIASEGQTLLIDPNSMLLVDYAVVSGSTLSYDVAIPDNPALAGYVIYAQMFVYGEQTQYTDGALVRLGS